MYISYSPKHSICNEEFHVLLQKIETGHSRGKSLFLNAQFWISTTNHCSTLVIHIKGFKGKNSYKTICHKLFMQRGLEFCSNNFSDNIPTGKDKSFQTKKNIGAILVLRNCPQRALPFLRYFLRQNFVTEANSCEILLLRLRWNYLKQISNKKQ